MNSNGKFESFVDETLYELHRPLFESVLTRSASDEARFEHRLKTFAYHGLLDFYSQVPFKPKPVFEQYIEANDGERIYTFAEHQIAAPNWKNRLIRKLKARRPNGAYVRHRLSICPFQIANDKRYLADIAKVLAYKWVELLGRPVSADCTIVKALMDADALIHFLDSFRFDNTSTSAMKTFLLRRETERLLFDKSGKFKDLMAGIEARLSLAGQNAVAELERLANDTSAYPKVGIDEVMAQVADSCRFVEQTCDWADGRKEHAAAMVRSIAGLKLTDESFRRAVDARIARRKAARKRLLASRRRRRPMWFIYTLSLRATLILTALLAALHIEFGHEHATIVDLISQWLN